MVGVDAGSVPTRPEYVTTRQAKSILQVSEATLRSWADNGLCPSIRSPGGKRMYNVFAFIRDRTTSADSGRPAELRKHFCYCRVSSSNQKDDLSRQVLYMQSRFPEHTVITDIGSGINFKRKGLRQLLELASKGLVGQVVVAYRDRLCRFAFELVEWVLRLHGVELLVLNETLDAGSESGGSTSTSELAEDLLAIINVFNCRVNGRRKYSNQAGKVRKTDQQPPEDGQTRGQHVSTVPPVPVR